MAGYKVNIQKSIAFLHPLNEQLEFEVKQTLGEEHVEGRRGTGSVRACSWASQGSRQLNVAE